jgi:AcrR family transcriptional regulator
MSTRPLSTREKILKSAAHLFYLEGVRSVSVDAIAERAGVTKKTLYYHFSSKDELIAAYLTQRDQPNLEVFARWLGEAEGPLPDRLEAFFVRVAEAGKHPKWRGCGFLRTTAELANMPGHPARLVGAGHKKKVEQWLEQQFRNEGIAEPGILARQISVLIDGAFSAMLVHRDPSYALMAGKAASALTQAAPRVEAAA